LLLFNRKGDCLAAQLRPGNVHSSDGWEELLLPEIERQQAQGKEVTFRGDAAFAKPELYEALEERDVQYAIRLPANDNLQRNITELLTRASGTAELQAGGAVQEFSLSGGELDDSPAGGGEGQVPLRGIVPPRRLHCDQSWDSKPGGGALLQQAWHGRAVDKGRQAGGQDDAA
jgi:Transposase DDE domain group 1